MIAFLGPIIAAVAPAVIKGVGGLFKKKKKDTKETETAEVSKPKDDSPRVAKEDLDDVIPKIVNAVMSKLGKSSKDDDTPSLSRSYAPAENTRLQKAPLASLDRTPIPATTPFLPKGAASLPPLGNMNW